MSAQFSSPITIRPTHYRGMAGASTCKRKSTRSAMRSGFGRMPIWPAMRTTISALLGTAATARRSRISFAATAGTTFRRLSKTNGGVIRAPQIIQEASKDVRIASPLRDQVVFENYDDGDYGYLRIIVDQAQLRIEYHPASDGDQAKTPDDSVTIDLKTRQTIAYAAPVLGRPQEVREVAAVAAKSQPAGEPAEKPRSDYTSATRAKKTPVGAKKSQKRNSSRKKATKKPAHKNR